MIITFKWEDKRYEYGHKWKSEIIDDEDWKMKLKTFNAINKQKGLEEAKEFLKCSLTTPKTRNKLMSIEIDKDNSYWSISFKE